MNVCTGRRSLIRWGELGAVFLFAISLSCHPLIANERKGSAAKLENIDWRVIGFGRLPVPETLGSHDMFFRLRSDGRRMRAFDGCNGIWANYRVTDEELQFVNVGRTEWTCSKAPEHRDAFMKLLASSGRWSVIGERLELYNTRDQLLVRFERSGEMRKTTSD